MKTIQQVTARLRSACVCAGGISAWCRLNGLMAQRGNIENMAKGKVKVSSKVADRLGLRRVMLVVYLENDETFPSDLAQFVVTHKPIPGRPKRKH